MSASSTWQPPRAPRTRRTSSASVALRFGRNPNDERRKSASKMGLNTSVAAICATRSRTVGIPSGRRRPSALGIYRRRTSCGRYVPARSAVPSSSRKASTPRCSISASVSLSTPAEPRFRLTRRHASRRTSSLQIRSIRAWKHRFRDRLAAAQRRRCNWRTWSRGARLSGELGPVSPAMPSRVLALTPCPPQGPFPPAAFCFTAIRSTMAPSDSRCAAPAFTFGLCGPRCPDSGCADGPLVFRPTPCPRAAPPTPPRPPARAPPDRGAEDVAFAVK